VKRNTTSLSQRESGRVTPSNSSAPATYCNRTDILLSFGVFTGAEDPCPKTCRRAICKLLIPRMKFTDFSLPRNTSFSNSSPHDENLPPRSDSAIRAVAFLLGFKRDVGSLNGDLLVRCG
jgi:hypothetical protein